MCYKFDKIDPPSQISEEYRQQFRESVNKLPNGVIDAIGKVYQPFIPTIQGTCGICGNFVMSNQSYSMTMTKRSIGIVHAECQKNEGVIRQVQFIDNLLRQRDEAVDALRRIASYMGQECSHSIFDDTDVAYAQGIESGYNAMAEIAQDALATIEAIGKVK